MKQKMTIERLNQYRSLRREVAMLEKEVISLREQARQPVSDTVEASLPEWPYTKHTVLVKGTQATTHAKLLRRIRRLDARRTNMEDELDAIDKWIGSIPDSATRQIVWMRYLRGMSWQQVANRVGGGNTADGVRKRVERIAG